MFAFLLLCCENATLFQISDTTEINKSFLFHRQFDTSEILL